MLTDIYLANRIKVRKKIKEKIHFGKRGLYLLPNEIIGGL